MMVKGVVGTVDLVGVDGTTVAANGTACTSDVKIKIANKAGVATVTVKADSDDQLQLKLSVPRSVAVLTVQDQTGPVTLRDLPTRFAAVSANGPIEVHGAQSVRLAYATGSVVVDEVHGDVTIDHLTGNLSAKQVSGDVALSMVTGPVQIDDVGGNLAVEGGTGGVSQTNVHGTVRLP